MQFIISITRHFNQIYGSVTLNFHDTSAPEMLRDITLEYCPAESRLKYFIKPVKK